MEVNGYKIKPKADLCGANLKEADLSGVNLANARLIGANLESTNFIKADLGLLALLALILQSIFCCIYLFPLLIH